MKTKINMILRIAVLSMVALTSAHALDRTWINASGGTFVGAGTNWLGGNIAGTGDVVLFDATGVPATYTVTLGANSTFQGLRNLAGDSVTVALGGRTLTLSTVAALRSRGVFDIQNGTLAAAGMTLDFGREGTATSKLSNVIASATTVHVGLVAIASTDSSNSLLTLETGTVLTATATTTIGGIGAVANSTSTNSKILVTGAASAFNGAEFRVGTTTNSTGNTLEVASGGALTGTNLSVGSHQTTGGIYSAGGNTVLIHGTNSKATMTGTISVGAANIATTVNNSLVVQNNGELVSSGSLIINGNGTAANTNNRVVIESGGKVTLNNTTNTVNFGFMEINGGTLEAKGLTINNQGRLNFVAGAITIDGNFGVFSGPGSRLAFDLTGDNPNSFTGITVSGNINSTVGQFVDILGISQTGNYTLFTFGSRSGNQWSLGNTPIGFTGSLVYNPNSLVLNVSAIPEPNTAVLLAAGLMVMLMRARRRGVRA